MNNQSHRIAIFLLSFLLFFFAVHADAARFSRSLFFGSRGQDVKELQQTLNTLGIVVSLEGPGSPGEETEYFGPATEAAVKRFQATQEIVNTGTPESTGYGVMGPRTRVALQTVDAIGVPSQGNISPLLLPSATTPQSPLTPVAPSPSPLPVSRLSGSEFCDINFSTDTFHVCYFDSLNPSYGADSVLAQNNEQIIDHQWGTGEIDATGKSDNISGIWRGRIYFQEGIYTFHTLSDDGVILNIDGFGDVISNWTMHGATQDDSGAIRLTAGYHNIILTWQDRGGDAVIKFWYDLSTSSKEESCLAGGIELKKIVMDDELGDTNFNFIDITRAAIQRVSEKYLQLDMTLATADIPTSPGQQNYLWFLDTNAARSGDEFVIRLSSMDVRNGFTAWHVWMESLIENRTQIAHFPAVKFGNTFSTLVPINLLYNPNIITWRAKTEYGSSSDGTSPSSYNLFSQTSYPSIAMNVGAERILKKSAYFNDLTKGGIASFSLSSGGEAEYVSSSEKHLSKLSSATFQGLDASQAMVFARVNNCFLLPDPVVVANGKALRRTDNVAFVFGNTLPYSQENMDALEILTRIQKEHLIGIYPPDELTVAETATDYHGYVMSVHTEFPVPLSIYLTGSLSYGWFYYLHEFGHKFHNSMYAMNQLLKYFSAEPIASELAYYAMDEVARNPASYPAISSSILNSIGQDLRNKERDFLNDLKTYEGQGAPFEKLLGPRDAFDPNNVLNGMILRIKEKYGIVASKRFFGIFQPALKLVEQSLLEGIQPTNSDQGFTMFVASWSAATEADLRPMFYSWNFPIDENYYAKAMEFFGVVTPGNLPPIIHEVKGPTTLEVGEVGEWKVKASDPENGPLSYKVFWGDEKQTSISLRATIQTATFTHSYSKAGIYQPTFVVTDDKNLTAKTSISVEVKQTPPPPPPPTASWIQVTRDGTRTTANSGKSGHFQFFSENEIYALGGNGQVYKWTAGQNPSAQWEGPLTTSEITDMFFVASDRKIYGLGLNGAIYRWDGSWTQITRDGARTSANSNKSGHFEIIDGFIYALGGDGAVYRWPIGITTNPNPGASRDKVTSDGGTDVFKRTSDGTYYILGQNGAVYRMDGFSWTQITKEGARTSINSGGKSGHFQFFSENEIYALGGDGAVHLWKGAFPTGSWSDALTASQFDDIFYVTPEKKIYALGQDGAIRRWNFESPESVGRLFPARTDLLANILQTLKGIGDLLGKLP